MLTGVVAGVVAGVLAGVALATAAPATAATAFRYWSFWLSDGSGGWTYASRGPASVHPADGDVEGWRFATQSNARDTLGPRAAPDFGALCAGTPKPADDKIRVGLVIDFGTAADAPPGERPPAGTTGGCVVVPSGSSGAEVLAAGASYSTGHGATAGLVCTISGYPSHECAPLVQAPNPAPTTTPRSPERNGPPAPTTTTPPSSTRHAPAAASTPTAPSTTGAPPASPPASPQATTPGPADPSSASSSQPPPGGPTPTLAALPGPGDPAPGGPSLPISAIAGGALAVVLAAAAGRRQLAGVYRRLLRRRRRW